MLAEKAAISPYKNTIKRGIFCKTFVTGHLVVCYIWKHNKDAGHEGLGTKLIQDIVKKHDGFLDFIHKDETFTVKIKIPAIQ